MMEFIVYEIKVAAILMAFYLCFRFLLKKETLHKLNRVVLVTIAAIPFILPFCIIEIDIPMEIEQWTIEPVTTIMATAIEPEVIATSDRGWWIAALGITLCIGIATTLLRIIISVISIMRIIRNGKEVERGDRYILIVTDREIDPFSWMKYIIISKEDWDGNHTSIIVHEKAHIYKRHSHELMLVNILAAMQWFNPAIWMLRSDLQELHEYEADEAVLKAGTDIKEYQYLLIKKAVSKSGYSVANSLNHSIIKKRITMMSKTKSPLKRGLKGLYVLPLVFLCLGLQAQTVNEQDKGKEISANGRKFEMQQSEQLYILRQKWGEEKEISKEELDRIPQERISSISIMTNEKAVEKYGKKGKNGAVIVNLKTPKPQELDEIVIVSYSNESENESFYLNEPENYASFQGEGTRGFTKWIFSKIYRPKGCSHAGTMKVSFVIGKDGLVKNVRVIESVCEELDAMAVSLIKSSPKWEPATTNGKPVEQCLTIPIRFEIR